VPRHDGIRTGRYTLVNFYTTGEWELFDLENDPHQLRSLHDDPAYASTAAELKEQLQRLRNHYGVPEKDYTPTPAQPTGAAR